MWSHYKYELFCQNWAENSTMLWVSGWFRRGSGTSRHSIYSIILIVNIHTMSSHRFGYGTLWHVHMVSVSSLFYFKGGMYTTRSVSNSAFDQPVFWSTVVVVINFEAHNIWMRAYTHARTHTTYTDTHTQTTTSPEEHVLYSAQGFVVLCFVVVI